MTGYGLSVFQGTKIERFDVEVISVLKDFNPKCDVVLIRCKGAFLKHTGSIAGMSGSPIYLRDGSGRDRMIGAFAYGWPMTKDPVAGVQPIEYMLRVPIEKETPQEASAAATEGNNHRAERHASWSLRDAGLLPCTLGRRSIRALSEARANLSSGQLTGDGSAPRLEPLATPLMTSGLSPRLAAKLAPFFREAGLTTLEAGGGGAATNDHPAAKLEPGASLAVPLLTGDVEMTAIGTVTEVIGDHMWGFGHPFNGEGRIDLPMGSGEINGVIANLQTSFKLGALTQLRGTLTTDASVCVAGEEGAIPTTIPIEVTVQPADGSGEHTYHFQASRHPKLTPMVAAAAFGQAVSGTSELPQYNTVDYNVQLSFTNGQTVTLANRAVNATGADLFGDSGIVLQVASENPFESVMVKKITGSVKVRATSESAQIIDVDLPKSHYHPGDKVTAFVTYQPFRGPEAVMPVSLDLPKDLPHGPYQIVVSDAQRYFTDEQQSRPFRFTAQNIGDVFAVLKDVAAIRENAVYVRLIRHPDGVAIGRTALPHLPSSRREILLASGRSDTTAYTSSTVRIIPTELVMSGAAEFAIQVDPPAKVSVGAPRGTKQEPASSTP